MFLYIKNQTIYIRCALLCTGISLFFFMLCRGIFYIYNQHILPLPTYADIFHSLRFDMSAAAYVNALAWFLFILPLNVRKKRYYHAIQTFFFIVPNFIAIGLELMDVAFFKFQNRRTLLTDFGLVKNTANLLPHYLMEYWYLILIGIVILISLIFLYKKTTHSQPLQKLKPFPQILLFLIGIALWFLAARGGYQLRPITPLSTAEVASDMRLMPFISNTTLNFLHSTGQTFITEKKYMSAAEAKATYDIYNNPITRDSFRPLNVVILTLESFGKEYSKYYNTQDTGYQGFTPFLDSLAEVSLQAEESFANGLRSAQGIVSITSGLPTLMDEPFVFSPYQSNRLDGLAAHLRSKGYQTAFFHGSNPGSMEFDKFAHLTGFEHFYDRYGYGNQADYDGNWGIWDAPMLQFVSRKLTEMPEPFYGFFFSLTSHHPYNVPTYFENTYPNIDPLHRSVLYADDALRQFFETAKRQTWFDRTLFVICADHTGAGSFVPTYQTKVGRYKIPILYYKPNEIKPQNVPKLTQQLDILPSILGFLQYDKPFLSFGRSIFEDEVPPQYMDEKNNILPNISINNPSDDSTHYSFHFEEGLYQIQDKQYVLFFNGDYTTGLYDYTTDIFMKQDLKNIAKTRKTRLEHVLKAVIQQYNTAMQTNTLVPNQIYK